MELRDFIAATINEIQEGVQLAIENSKKRNTRGAINPCFRVTTPELKGLVQNVQFDIAVTVNDKSADKVDGGIKVVALTFGAGMTESTENSKVSRIQFSIPLIPPTTEVNEVKLT